MIQDLKKEKSKDLIEELELSQQKYNNLKKVLSSFSKEIQEQILEKEVEKETELHKLKEENQVLEEELVKEKKNQLEKLKNEFVEKIAYGDIVKAQSLCYNNHLAVIAEKKEKEYLLKKKSVELIELFNDLCERQKEISLLEVQVQQIIVQEKQTTFTTFKERIIGAHLEKDRSRLVISEQLLQSQQVAELGRKIVEQQFEIQRIEEQQTQIEQLPK
ncbi:5975_t:CDS:2 [Ambispora gerdemannii]|uniref:5975_t:CDS:1 n=1 Tax=Ambispora gerdemannii TaxID=144530 RepID=A0A9N9EZ08_9GLOM|nr:5975_t:CDS:2 [Ambispora gerdemannii]